MGAKRSEDHAFNPPHNWFTSRSLDLHPIVASVTGDRSPPPPLAVDRWLQEDSLLRDGDDGMVVW